MPSWLRMHLTLIEVTTLPWHWQRPRSEWQLLTTNTAPVSKAEYTPRPAVYAPNKTTVEEVVTEVITDGGGATGVGNVISRENIIDGGNTFYDYVSRSASASPILTRRRVRSVDR